MLREIIWVDGRNGRGRYWIIAALEIAAVVFYLVAVVAVDPENAVKNLLGGTSIIGLAAFSWISLVNRIRRYHDLNKSGWWLFFAFLPIIGPIWQFIELGFIRGTDGDNHYGPTPGSFNPTFESDDERGQTPNPASGLAKVDDAYLAAYARRLAEQNQGTSSNAAAPAFSAAQGGGTFGKRR